MNVPNNIFNCRLIIAAICGALCFMPQSGIAQNHIKTKTVKAWEDYFQHINTLKLEYKVVNSKGKSSSGGPYKSSFYLDGDLFRLENNFKPGGYKTLFICAFNGKRYQDFGVFSGGSELTLSKKNESDLPYSGVPLPISLFSFTMGRKDIWSFRTMKNSDHWKKLAKGMTYVRSRVVNGEQHHLFKVNVGRGTWQVEVEGKKYFPLAISARVTTSGGDTVIGTTTVTSKTTWSADGHQYYFPSL